jgi:pyruvate/2-oxoglutarate dehydrogenase complex dihydrolipoamide acyltransferase (E2) component
MKVQLNNTNAIIQGLQKAGKDMRVIGIKAIEYVEKQVEAETDADGKKFPSYSAIWQKVREKKGLLPADRVDLTITGHMLRSMDVIKHGTDYVKVGFNNLEAIRSAKGVLHNKKRPIQFMGLTEKNRARLVAWFWRKFTNRQLRNTGGTP